MNLKAFLGAAVAFFVMAYLTNTYLYLPTSASNPAPGTALLPMWGSLLVTALLDTAFLDWANKKIKNAMSTAIILAVAQILLVDVYYVLNGTRSVVAAGASAVTLLVIWVTGGYVYGKLSASS